jgi:hypothetical protein
MKPDGWIEIHNWDRFQHYRDRDPVWIKNYTALLSDDDYLALSTHLRAVLHGLWLMYASSRCRIRVDTASLSRHLQCRVRLADLVSLNDAGFLHFRASKPLARRYQDASPEEEKEVETPPTPPSRPKGGRSNQRKPTVKPTGWREVRGTHGLTYVPDPFGTDRPPYPVPPVPPT